MASTGTHLGVLGTPRQVGVRFLGAHPDQELQLCTQVIGTLASGLKTEGSVEPRHVRDLLDVGTPDEVQLRGGVAGFVGRYGTPLKEAYIPLYR